MKNIVISLKTATARREHICNEFEKQNIDFNFFDALTPDLAKPLAEKIQLNIAEGALTQGELACFMSHLAVWKKIIDENISYAAIFEDDIYLGNNAEYFLSNNKWLNPEWGIIKLEAFSKKVYLSNNRISIGCERALCMLKGRHLGGAGYILTQNSAQYLYNLVCNISICEPLDHILFDPVYHTQYKIYQMNPAICIQSYLYDDKKYFFSSLENQRKKRRYDESKNRKILEKIFRELKRIFINFKNIFVKKRIQFK